MSPSALESVLRERQAEMEKYLSRFEKEQRAMRKEKHLGHSSDMLECLAHQVGYMTGALEQTKQLIEMLGMTDEEFLERHRLSEESMRLVREQLRGLRARITADEGPKVQLEEKLVPGRRGEGRRGGGRVRL